MLLAALEIPWPLAWLAGLISVAIALASAAVIVRSTTIKQNLQLVREERDDYAKAHEHEEKKREKAEAERDELHQRLREEQDTCKLAISELEGKVKVLEGVVSGASAIKELGDLIVLMSTTAHNEVMAAIQANASEIKTLEDAIFALLGDRTGRRRRDKANPDAGAESASD